MTSDRSLQRALAHVARLRQFVDDELAEMICFDPAHPTIAELWLTGRGDEIAAFAADVLQERGQGIISGERAAAILESYIETVHDGFFSHVDDRNPLRCCGARRPSPRSDSGHGSRSAATVPMTTPPFNTPTPSNL